MESRHFVYYYCSRLSMRTTPWQQVFLEDAILPEVDVPHHMDPREHYVSEIFASKRFSVASILKALHVSLIRG